MICMSLIQEYVDIVFMRKKKKCMKISYAQCDSCIRDMPSMTFDGVIIEWMHRSYNDLRGTL